MYKRTFEVLAKYVSEKNDVKIVFDTDGGAYADMKNDILHLPKEIADKHAYSAVSLMMHESAHIKHSKIIPINNIVKTNGDFHILNAIEDIRIDKINFSILPNIHDFYEELMNEVKNEIDLKAPLPARALCATIAYLEGFSTHAKAFGKDAVAMARNLFSPVEDATYAIENLNWAEVRAKIDEIKAILQIPPDQDQPLPTPIQVSFGIGTDPCDGGKGNKAEGEGQSGKGGKDPLGCVEGIMRPGKIFSTGQGSGMGGGSGSVVGALAMEEQCANQFKEILNMKQRKTVSEGNILNTENLTDFALGEIETLFKQEKIIKKKKSKIMFLLDASGSMDTQLLDGKTRANVVSKSVKKMTEILEEVINLEGINIDWGINAFQGSSYPLSKNNWQNEYRIGGGTCFDSAFIETMDQMLKDYTIDGKKIIIAITDGDVNDREIVNVKESVMRNYSDVKALIISVGSPPTSKIAKELTGDNIIVAEDNATAVIMETIKCLL